MKHNVSKHIINALLAFIVLVGLIPAFVLTVHAGHVCPNCEEWIDGSPYCEDCYECEECCELCLECGKCSDCSGWEICDDCAEDDICVDCALDKGYHCDDCYDCYMKEQLWCDECGRCKSCVDICDPCSENLGKGVLCVECALDEGSHCPDCNECYFEVGSWCEECLLCENCSPICEGCSETEGEIICAACAIDAGLHCSDCTDCYDESNWEYCTECGVCANCREYCDIYELCLDCAVESGYHCPSCDGCCEDEPICESCGDACRECADDFCESCGMCSDCVQVCPSCGACSNCAEICPNCEEYCSDCEDVCDDCEYCLVCCADIAAFEGCDCSDWVCAESNHWQAHFDEAHIHTPQDGHTARPSKAWSWDDSWHWQACVYCDDTAHHSNKFAHTYDKRGMCTVCCYAKNSNIQILQQPVDVNHVNVQSPYEDYDNSNIAHFSVKAVGKSELTYTWYRRYYTAPGQWDYTPLTDPAPGEVFEGPDLYVLASTDACYNADYFFCIILDEEGNQARTVEVMLSARHHYQYFKCWKGDYPDDPYETAGRAPNYHYLQCVGEGCEKVTNIRPHEDNDENDECDICRREMPEILITEQPKSVKNVLATSSDEDPLESNYATFSVKAEGKSKLTYTWCRRYYTAPGQWHYQPLTNPGEGEVYDAPTARILAPGDACTNTYYYCCIITDEEGNQAQTIEVSLKGKHNYQYYKYYKSQTGQLPGTKRKEVGHVVMCVGDACGKMSRLSSHIDVDKDFCCDICYYIKFIDELTLEVAVPKVGSSPDYGRTLDSPICSIRGNGSLAYRRWYVSDNGTDGWKLMSQTDTFAAGKYYKVSVDVSVVESRQFSTYPTPTTVHTVWLWVNDRRGTVTQTGSLPHKNYATLEYVYYCVPEQVKTITIEGLDSPVAGQKPDYEVTLGGSGFKLDTGSTLYHKNGITWRQYGAEDAMLVDSRFIAVKNYTCYITLVAEENYVFDSNIIATVNGHSAVWELYNDNKTAVVSYAYTQIPPARIKEVNLTGVTVPWEGVETDWNVNLNSDLFYIDEMGWSDLTLNAGHYGAFEVGHRYAVGFYLITNLVDGHFQCEFDENVIATVNGQPATVLTVYYDGYYGSCVYIEYLCPPTGEQVKLLSQPVSVQVKQGEKATVTVAASGTELKYQWQYRTSSSGSWKNASAAGNTTATLSIPATVSRHGYQYRCCVTDGAGNQVYSKAATLNVLGIQTQPASTSVLAGKTAKLTVSATGASVKYQWQYRTSSSGSWKNASATGNKTATISVPATANRNGYQYRCKVSDKYGNVVYSKTATLKVVTLAVTTQPANKYLPAGKTATFTVKASGTGLKYQWQYRTSSSGSWKNASATGNKTATISVPATANRNGYQYRCKITDKYGNVIHSNAATLKLVTLKITTQPTSVTLAKGKTATFKVVAQGTGLTYQWQYRTSEKGSWKAASATGNKTATLKVPVTAARNGYQYRCVITDKYGNVINSNAATLKVK